MNEPAPNGRFRARHGVQALLDEVLGVLVGVAGGRRGAEAVSVRRFNAARAEGVPSAQGVCSRLSVSWDQARQLALAEVAERGHLLGHFTRRPEFNGDEDLVQRSLRAVAHRIGEPLAAYAYDDAVERLEKEQRRRRGGRLGLPHSSTIIERCGSWRAACEQAGVRAVEISGPPTRKAEPAVEVLDRFVTETGLLPPQKYLRPWARHHGVLLGRDSRRYAALVAQLRERRRQRGETTPEGFADLSELPPLPEGVLGRPGGGRGISRQEVLTSLLLYAQRHLEEGRLPRYKHYQAARRRDPQLVNASALRRHGRFQDLCREAGI